MARAEAILGRDGKPARPSPLAPWRGIILVANTPFTADGALDVDSIRRFADHLADAGCPAVLLRGVAAETAFLDPNERAELVRSFADATRGRFDLIAGLSTTGRDAIVEETKAALDAGATAINWRPAPDTDAADLTDTLLAIEAAGARAIMLQDFDIAGPGLQLDAILAAHRDVAAFAGIKVETSDNLAKSTRIAATVTRPLTLCAGWPVTGMIASFNAGMHAFMPTGLAALLQQTYVLHSRGERDSAIALFERLAALHAVMSETLGQSIAVNKLLRMREGLFATDLCRHPDARLPAEMRPEAERLIEAAVALQRQVWETA